MCRKTYTLTACLRTQHRILPAVYGPANKEQLRVLYCTNLSNHLSFTSEYGIVTPSLNTTLSLGSYSIQGVYTRYLVRSSVVYCLYSSPLSTIL